jgi:acetyltransferase-like isoleucine patch superfamily enzyme
MTSMLARVVRKSRAALRLTYDQTIVPFWLRQLGVEVGSGCRFEGMPIVKPGRGCSIRLGHHVTLFSRPDSNPRGVSHPVILAALAPGATIEIGDYTSMTGVSTAIRASLTIGKHVQVGPGACLWDNDGHALNADERRDAGRQQTVKRAPIVIEDDAFIGARAIILKGVTIGKGAIVGAGAIVTKDVQPGDIVAGNPARVIGSTLQTNNLAKQEAHS